MLKIRLDLRYINVMHRARICDYIMRTLRTHNLYAYKFICCELLNLVNVIGKIF